MEQITYGQAVPGDVLVLGAGDTRQLLRSELQANPAYLTCQWGDGTQSVQERHGYTTRLYPKPSNTKPKLGGSEHDAANPDPGPTD